jgi:hypothetical protein
LPNSHACPVECRSYSSGVSLRFYCGCHKYVPFEPNRARS